MIEYTINRNNIISPKGGSVINIKHELSSDNYFLFDVLQYIYDKTCFILFIIELYIRVSPTVALV